MLPLCAGQKSTGGCVNASVEKKKLFLEALSCLEPVTAACLAERNAEKEKVILTGKEESGIARVAMCMLAVS